MATALTSFLRDGSTPAWGRRWRRRSAASCPLWRFMPRIQTRNRIARPGRREAMGERLRVRAGRGLGKAAGWPGAIPPPSYQRREGPSRSRLSFLIVCLLFFSSFALGEKGGLVSVGYGEDDFSRLDGDEEGYEEEDDENSRQSVSILRFLGLVLLAAMRCNAFCSWESLWMAPWAGTWWHCHLMQVSALPKYCNSLYFQIEGACLGAQWQFGADLAACY